MMHLMSFFTFFLITSLEWFDLVREMISLLSIITYKSNFSQTLKPKSFFKFYLSITSWGSFGPFNKVDFSQYLISTSQTFHRLSNKKIFFPFLEFLTIYSSDSTMYICKCHHKQVSSIDIFDRLFPLAQSWWLN